MTDATPLWLVYTTCPNIDVANKIAGDAVDQKLTACANILPSMQSVYEWKGAIATEQEVVVLLKTTPDKYKDLEAFVLQNHPYETPCVMALPVSTVADGYLSWVMGSLG